MKNFLVAKEYLFLIFGSLLYGAAVGTIIGSNQIAPGGITGVSVILSSFIPVGVGTFSIALNIPLLILGRIRFGRRFFFATIFAIIISGISADLCSAFLDIKMDIIPAVVLGGGIMGLGCGMVFLGGGTTGGTDIVAKFIKRKKPYLQTGRVFLFVDGLVCIISGIAFASINSAVYSFAALVVFSRVLDLVLGGGKSAKLVLVMSNKSDILLSVLLKKADVGCTVLNGVSGYEKRDMKILLCAVKIRRLQEIRKVILDTDEKAFMLVGDVGEIFGEGFKSRKTDIV